MIQLLKWGAPEIFGCTPKVAASQYILTIVHTVVYIYVLQASLSPAQNPYSAAFGHAVGPVVVHALSAVIVFVV